MLVLNFELCLENYKRLRHHTPSERKANITKSDTFR